MTPRTSASERTYVINALRRVEQGERDSLEELRSALCGFVAALRAEGFDKTRATQVVGIDSFRQGHAVERLAQDVRALELFAGRTEALREAVADEILPGRQHT